MEGTDGVLRRVEGPREFRHTLGTILNRLIANHFALLGVQEETGDDPNPEAGSWEHYKQVTAWILSLWTVYRA